jgi:hypothetical protein
MEELRQYNIERVAMKERIDKEHARLESRVQRVREVGDLDISDIF